MPLDVLCVGGGSIGERHLRCFQQTDPCRVAICEMLEQRRQRLEQQYGVDGYATIDEAASRNWDLVVVATPAHLHIDHAMQFRNCTNAWLIEKPLSTSSEQIDELRAAAAGKVLNVAYVYRVHPAVQAIRKLIRQQAFGEVLELIVTAGQHFPTFRPAYREIYYTDRRTGGGAVQDGATHFFDLSQFLVGPFDWVFCDYAHQALEGVNVEDTVHLTARAADQKIMVNIALNQFMAPNETTVQVNAVAGSIRLQMHEHRFGVMRMGETQWKWSESEIHERDDLFRRQAQCMVDACMGKHPVMCTLDEAAHTLKVTHAALESAGERVVPVR